MDKINGNKTSAHFRGNRTSLARMLAGQRGKIVGIGGGYGLARKLDALGIRKGKDIRKISGQWMRGPVLLQCGNTQIALGFGMSSRVLVEISGDS